MAGEHLLVVSAVVADERADSVCVIVPQILNISKKVLVAQKSRMLPER